MRALYKENLGPIRKNCKENIASVDVNLVQSGINLVEVLFEQMKETYGVDAGKLSHYECDNLSNMILAFAFVWSVGGNLTDQPRENRDFFSNQMKPKITKLIP